VKKDVGGNSGDVADADDGVGRMEDRFTFMTIFSKLGKSEREIERVYSLNNADATCVCVCLYYCIEGWMPIIIV
jgi:hypothetical protein